MTVMSCRLPVIVALIGIALPQTSWGQVTDLTIGASALISVQPVVDDYVGRGPYLSGPGLGGIGPGVSAAVNVVTERGLSITAEFSTARFEGERSGRVATGRATVHDSMLGGLLGYALRSGRTQTHFLGGLYWLLDEPKVGGKTLSDLGLVGPQDDLPVAVAGGLDFLQRLGTKVWLVVGARYAYIATDDRQSYFGISPHVLRVSVGLRVPTE